jgi:hypothetical protein
MVRGGEFSQPVMPVKSGAGAAAPHIANASAKTINLRMSFSGKKKTVFFFEKKKQKPLALGVFAAGWLLVTAGGW